MTKDCEQPYGIGQDLEKRSQLEEQPQAGGSHAENPGWSICDV